MSPSRYDEDSDDERLPEGMTRIGYDADTQVYTFRDADGSLWEGAPGCKFGRLARVSGPPAGAPGGDDDDDVHGIQDADDYSAPFLSRPFDQEPRPSWRQDMMPFLNFGLLAGLSLIALFYFLYRSPATDLADVNQLASSCPGSSLVVQQGDTCWALAEAGGISVEDLERSNSGLDCDRLVVGSLLCLPD